MWRRVWLAVLVLAVDRLHGRLRAKLLLIVLLWLHALLLRVVRGGKGASLGYTGTRLLLRREGLLLGARRECRLLRVRLSTHCLRVWWL